MLTKADTNALKYESTLIVSVQYYIVLWFSTVLTGNKFRVYPIKTSEFFPGLQRKKCRSCWWAAHTNGNGGTPTVPRG